MKKYIFLLVTIFLISSCEKLDLNPLSEGSSENWYSNQQEIEMALNDAYRTYLWSLETNFEGERRTDNWSQRTSIKDIAKGTVDGKTSFWVSMWKDTYKGISRMNRIINNIEDPDKTIDASQEVIMRLKGEAHLFRAVFYGRLIFLYGDVPYLDKNISIDEALAKGRTDKDSIRKLVYKDFDEAINVLPNSYGSNELYRATKGAALGFKARTALRLGDFEIVKESAKEVMEGNQYSLAPDYGEYFLPSTRTSPENIFTLPQSEELGRTFSTKNFYTRNPGGGNVAQPSWELLAAYTCVDGKAIDESPLFDPSEPFKNRDPRLKETIVEFGSEHLGYIYSPHPNDEEVLNTATGRMVTNNDNRSVMIHAAYNGLATKKRVDESWIDGNVSDFNYTILRYADILLMYAEAKIELDEIDQSVLDAMNQVRARAYKIDYKNYDGYPAIVETNQIELRNILRNERRVEFAWENRRFFDLMRWKLADKALTRPVYGLLDSDALKSKVVDTGNWFWPEAPKMDEYGLPDFSEMYSKGYIKIMSERNFDERQYLLPIPSDDIRINENLKQNPGY